MIQLPESLILSLEDGLTNAVKEIPVLPTDMTLIAAIIAENSSEIWEAAYKFKYERKSKNEVYIKARQVAITAIRILMNI